MADRRLQVFHTVARLLSFTKAAETLHMTQPAVTFQIRQLEEYFNTRLFDRTHNKISLTAAGDRVFQYADKIISLYSEMENNVREITGDVSGILIIGASTTIAEYVLPQLLGAFKETYPNINLRLRVSNSLGIVHMVEDNSVDAVISNCVINLSPDKSAVFGEIYRSLKPGGRIIISDILSYGEIPEEIRNNPAAYTG